MNMDMGSSLLGTAWVVGLGILSIFALGDTAAAENARLVVMPIMAASILGVLSLYFYTKSLTEEIEGRKHNNSTFVKVLIGLGVIMAAPITMLIDFFVLPMIHALFVGAYSALQNNPVVEYKILDFLYEPKYQIPIIIGQWAIFIALAIVYKYEEKCFHRAL